MTGTKDKELISEYFSKCWLQIDFFFFFFSSGWYFEGFHAAVVIMLWRSDFVCSRGRCLASYSIVMKHTS